VSYVSISRTFLVSRGEELPQTVPLSSDPKHDHKVCGMVTFSVLFRSSCYTVLAVFSVAQFTDGPEYHFLIRSSLLQFVGGGDFLVCSYSCAILIEPILLRHNLIYVYSHVIEASDV
jgi:hypothetical protein